MVFSFFSGMKKFSIKKDGGRLTEAHREILIDQIRRLPDGGYEVIIQEETTGSYTPTRYRYYFGHIVEVILLTCGDKFRVVGANGELRPLRTSKEVHEALKFLYNPVTVITPKGAYQTGLSTTGLSDRKFIGEYAETILAEFSQPPYNCDFMLYDEWKEFRQNQRGVFPESNI